MNNFDDGLWLLLKALQTLALTATTLGLVMGLIGLQIWRLSMLGYPLPADVIREAWRGVLIPLGVLALFFVLYAALYFLTRLSGDEKVKRTLETVDGDVLQVVDADEDDKTL